jgi:DNA cross-link repair 1C protein
VSFPHRLHQPTNVSVRFAETTEPIVEDIRRMLLAELQSARTSISLTEEDGLVQDGSEISLTQVGEALVRKLARKERGTIDEEDRQDLSGANSRLPKLITFPYSRHSSCSELQHLVSIFKPKDVFPCTVDEENWHEGKPLINLPTHCYCKLIRPRIQYRASFR